MSYVESIMDLVVRRNPAEPEFHQAVKEVLDSIAPASERSGPILPRRMNATGRETLAAAGAC